MRLTTLIIFVSLLIPGWLMSSENSAEELKKQLESSSGQERVEILNKLAEKIAEEDTASSDTYLEQALGLSRKIGFRSGESRTLKLIGDNHVARQEFDAAEKALHESLKLAEDSSDRKAVAVVCDSIGRACFRQRKFEKALEPFLKALHVNIELDDIEGTIKSYNNIALTYRNTNDFNKALLNYEKGLALAEEHDDYKNQAFMLNNIGRVYQYLDDWEKVSVYHTRALQVSEANNDQSGMSYSLMNLGHVHCQLGLFTQASEYYERAFEIDKTMNNTKNIALDLGNLGNVYSLLNEHQKAIDSFSEALTIFEQFDDKGNMASSYDNIGLMFSRKNDFRKAIEYHEKALHIREEIGEKRHIANSYNNIGTVYDDIGDYERALDYYLKGLKLREEIDDRAGIATSLGNIGIIYKLMNNHEGALDCYQKAYDIFSQIKNPPGIIRMLGNIGNLYEKSGDLENAITYQKRALNKSEELGYDDYIASNHQNLGVAYEKTGQLDLALAHYQKAFDFQRKIKDELGQATSLLNIGNIAFTKKQYSEARTWYVKCLEITVELDSKDTLQSVYAGLAEVNAAQGNFQEAYTYLKEHTLLKAELLNQRTNEKIAELQTRFEVDQQDKEISLLAKDNELLQKNNVIQKLQLSKERITARSFIAGFFLVLILLLLLFKKYLYLFAFWKKKSYIGHYRILEKIGSGGMGNIYRAAHILEKSRSVAIKVIRDEFAADETQRKRFLHEALLIDQLNHPNIVKVYERGEYNNQLYIAMEMLEGESLTDFIQSKNPISICTHLSLMLQINDALIRIHDKGILHRDLKPDNIMIIKKNETEELQVKLLDFGLAKNQSLTRLTQTGEFVGTIYYIPPEQISMQEFTRKSDIYSLGIVYYEMVTGETPFMGEQPLDIIQQILDKEPLAPSSFNKDLPPTLDRLILAMIQKNPSMRPDGWQIQDTISGLLEDLCPKIESETA